MAIKYKIKGQPSLGSISLNPEFEKTGNYSANTNVIGKETIPYEAYDDQDPNLKSESNIFVTILQKPKPCDYKNIQECKGICSYQDWLTRAQNWFSKFIPDSSRHPGWKELWYWFPNTSNNWNKNWCKPSGYNDIFRKNNKITFVSNRFINHLRYYEIPKALSTEYNQNPKPNQQWLKDEWWLLLNCYYKANNYIIGSIVRHDPLAQTFFTTEEGVFISGISIYFEKKSSAPVSVILTKTNNGYPDSSKIIAKKTLNSDEIHESDDGSVETFFKFDDLIYVEPNKELAFIVFTPDTNTKIFLAEIGKPEILTENIITKQPASGVLFKSPNNSTWVASPTLDLKFKIYHAEFTPNTDKGYYTVEFNEVSGIEFSVFNFDVPIVYPDKTVIYPEFSVDGGQNWKKFELGENVELDKIYTSIIIRLRIHGNFSLSPIIKEVGTLKLIKYKPSGRYIIRTLETIDNFENCRIIFMAHLDPGTEIKPYYSKDDGETWIEITNATQVNIDGYWTEYDFKEENIFPSINKLKMKIEMHTNDLSKTPKIKDLRMLLY